MKELNMVSKDDLWKKLERRLDHRNGKGLIDVCPSEKARDRITEDNAGDLEKKINQALDILDTWPPKE